ncbi:MAG: fasciclin domain-containing protein [Bacteroidetes bacterium]|nr:fasciclin domain-containing protein [Bacteroidota bacterium]
MVKSGLLVLVALAFFSCSTSTPDGSQNQVQVSESAVDPGGGQASVTDDQSQKNILQIALGSNDHKTLVAAVQAAKYENALVNAGPFTVFAPTDAAFGELPDGTVESLVKPENQKKLQDILEYHVFIGGLKTDALTDGRVLGMANGGKVTCSVDGDAVKINGATIVATVPCSNGYVHVVDKVLLPE